MPGLLDDATLAALPEGLRRRLSAQPDATPDVPAPAPVVQASGGWGQQAVAGALHSFVGNYNALAGAAEQATGFQDAADKNFAAYQEHAGMARKLGPAIQSFDDARAAGGGLGDYGKALGYQAVGLVPDLALAAVTGGIGEAGASLAARGVARRLGTRAAVGAAERTAATEGAAGAAAAAGDTTVAGTARVAELQASEASQAAAKAAADALFNKSTAKKVAEKVGHTLGTGAAFVPATVAGSVEELQKTDADGAKKLLLTDSLAAVAGALPMTRFLNKIGLGSAASAAEKSVAEQAGHWAGRIAKETGIQATAGAAGAMAMTATQLAGHKWVNDNAIGLMSPEAFNHYFDSVVTGTAFGAVLGGGAEAAKVGIGSLRNRTPAADTGPSRLDKLKDWIAVKGTQAEGALGSRFKRTVANPDDPINQHHADMQSDDVVTELADRVKQSLADSAHESLMQGNDPLIGDLPRAKNTNPIEMPNQLQQALMGFVPADHPIWADARQAKRAGSALEKAMAGEDPTPGERATIRYLMNTGGIDPVQFAKIQLEGGKYIGPLREAAQHSKDFGDTFDAAAATHEAVKAGETEAAPDAQTQADAVYAGTADANAKPDKVGAESMINGAEAPLDAGDRLSSLYQSKDNNPEHAAEYAKLHGELRDSFLGKSEQVGRNGNTTSWTGNNSFVRNNLAKADFVTKEQSPNTVRAAEDAVVTPASKTDNGKDFTQPRLFDLSNIAFQRMSKVSAEAKNAGEVTDTPGNIGLLRGLADMKAVGVEIDPSTFKSGDIKLEANAAKGRPEDVYITTLYDSAKGEKAPRDGNGVDIAQLRRDFAPRKIEDVPVKPGSLQPGLRTTGTDYKGRPRAPENTEEAAVQDRAQKLWDDPNHKGSEYGPEFDARHQIRMENNAKRAQFASPREQAADIARRRKIPVAKALDTLSRKAFGQEMNRHTTAERLAMRDLAKQGATPEKLQGEGEIQLERPSDRLGDFRAAPGIEVNKPHPLNHDGRPEHQTGARGVDYVPGEAPLSAARGESPHQKILDNNPQRIQAKRDALVRVGKARQRVLATPEGKELAAIIGDTEGKKAHAKLENLRGALERAKTVKKKASAKAALNRFNKTSEGEHAARFDAALQKMRELTGADAALGVLAKAGIPDAMTPHERGVEIGKVELAKDYPAEGRLYHQKLNELENPDSGLSLKFLQEAEKPNSKFDTGSATHQAVDNPVRRDRPDVEAKDQREVTRTFQKKPLKDPVAQAAREKAAAIKARETVTTLDGETNIARVAIRRAKLVTEAKARRAEAQARRRPDSAAKPAEVEAPRQLEATPIGPDNKPAAPNTVKDLTRKPLSLNKKDPVASATTLDARAAAEKAAAADHSAFVAKKLAEYEANKNATNADALKEAQAEQKRLAKIASDTQAEIVQKRIDDRLAEAAFKQGEARDKAQALLDKGIPALMKEASKMSKEERSALETALKQIAGKAGKIDPESGHPFAKNPRAVEALERVGKLSTDTPDVAAKVSALEEEMAARERAHDDWQNAEPGDEGKPTRFDDMKPGEHVTLYRGESAANDANGQWWTTDRALAEGYGKVQTVTLPTEVVGKHAARGANNGTEFVFPTKGKRPNELRAELDAAAKPIAHDHKTEGGLVNAILEALGFKSKINVMSDPRNSNGSFSAKGQFIRLSNDLHGAERMEVLGHETGHAVIAAHIAKILGVDPSTLRDTDGGMLRGDRWMDKLAEVDPELHKELSADYEAWLAGVDVNGDKNDIRASRAPLFRGLEISGRDRNTPFRELKPAQMRELLSMNEWVADHISRAITSSKEGQGVIEKFFGEIAKTLRKVYDALFGAGHKEVAAAPSVEKWVKGMFDTHAQMVKDVTGVAVSPDKATQIAGAALAIKNGASVLNPRSILDLVTYAKTVLSPEQRLLLLSRLNRKAPYQVLTKIYGDLGAGNGRSMRDMMNDAAHGDDFKIALAILLESQKGSGEGANGFDIGPKGASVLLTTVDQLMAIAGLAGEGRHASRLLADIASGHLEREIAAGKQYDPKALEAESRGTRQKVLNEISASKPMVKLGEYYTRAMSSNFSRLAGIGAAEANALNAKLFRHTGATGEHRGMVYDMREAKHTFAMSFKSAFDGLSEEEVTAAIDHLQLMKGANNMAHLSENSQKAVRSLRKTMDEAYTYAKNAGMRLPETRDFFPVQLKIDTPERVKAMTDLISQPKFAESIANLDIFKEWQASDKPPTHEQLINSLVQGASGDKGAATSGAGAPNFTGENQRIMAFIHKVGTAEDVQAFADLQTKDPAEVYVRYIDPLVKKAEYVRNFGQKGERLIGKYDKYIGDHPAPDAKLIKDGHLQIMRQQGASEADVKFAENTVKAVLGLYGADGSPSLRTVSESLADASARPGVRNVIKGVAVYQNARLLGLATLSSLIDPMGVAVRSGGDFGLMTKGLKSTVKAVSSKIGRQEMRDWADRFGNVDDMIAMNDLQADAASESGFLRKANDFIFKVNGLSAYTRFTRYAGLQTAQMFLLKHAAQETPESKRYFEELGLKPGDIQATTEVPPGGGPERPAVKMIPISEWGDATPEAREAHMRVRRAMMQFTDEALLRPNSQQTPLWHSDPYMKLFSQYKSFGYAIYDQIGGRIGHEIRSGNMKVIAPMLMYVPGMVMAGMLRSGIQYGSGGNPNRDDWGPAEYLGDGVLQTQLAGPGKDLYVSTVRDVRAHRTPIIGQLGPTVGQANRLASSHTISAPGDTFESLLPGQNIWSKRDNGSPDQGLTRRGNNAAP